MTVPDEKIGAVAEQPARQHLEAAAITDLDSAEVSQTQVALVEELRGIPVWKVAAGATDSG